MKTIYIKDWYNLSFEEQNSFTGILKWNDKCFHYIENGRTHRLDGPAIVWNNNEFCYIIHGVEYTKEQWERHPEVVKNSKEFKNVIKYKESI